jgi:ATP-dependent helicase HrpB
LELKALEIDDLESFPWFERPKESLLESCADLLFRLGALAQSDIHAPLTTIGRQLAELPTHPRLSKLCLEGSTRGVLEQAATLAAALSEGELDRLDARDALRSLDRNPWVQRVRSQLLQSFTVTQRTRPALEKRAQEGALEKSVLSAFPDRVAQRKKDSQKNSQLIFSLGGSGELPSGNESDTLDPKAEFFVVLDAQNFGRGRTVIRSLLPIEPDWLIDLEPPVARESEELQWDATRKQVLSKSILKYDGLVLAEFRATSGAPHSSSISEQATELLIREGLGIPKNRFADLRLWIEKLGGEALESSLARAHWVSRTFPEKEIPTTFPDGLFPLFRGPLLQGATRLSEIEAMDWPQALLEYLEEKSKDGFVDWDRLVPTTLALPSGRKSRIHYRLDQAPWVESRLQDFFGMKRTPTLLEGRVKLTLHLLAPNQRAVQVTQDLESFWTKTYPEVRTALMRRYPRHSWPESVS